MTPIEDIKPPKKQADWETDFRRAFVRDDKDDPHAGLVYESPNDLIKFIKDIEAKAYERGWEEDGKCIPFCPEHSNLIKDMDEKRYFCKAYARGWSDCLAIANEALNKLSKE